MLCVSIVFYTLSAGKKNVLKKMEGYTTGNILLGEIKAFAPALCLCFLLIFAAAMICAVWLHPVATWQFGLFLRFLVLQKVVSKVRFESFSKQKHVLFRQNLKVKCSYSVLFVCAKIVCFNWKKKQVFVRL